MSDQLVVGKVRDAHGMKGELYLISFSKTTDWLENAQELLFEGAKPNKSGKHENDTQKFKVKSYRSHKTGAIVKLEGLSTRTQAEALIGYTVQVTREAITSKKGESIFLAEIEGFEVFDREKSLGTIVGFSSNGAQDLLIVKEGEQKREVPIIKEFLLEILWDSKQIKMQLPEGLWE